MAAVPLLVAAPRLQAAVPLLGAVEPGQEAVPGRLEPTLASVLAAVPLPEAVEPGQEGAAAAEFELPEPLAGAG